MFYKYIVVDIEGNLYFYFTLLFINELNVCFNCLSMTKMFKFNISVGLMIVILATVIQVSSLLYYNSVDRLISWAQNIIYNYFY